jgi:hypothetical protein
MARPEQHHAINRRLLVSLALILCSVMSLYNYFGNVAAQTQTTTSCTDIHGPYVLEGNDNGLYGIVGIPFNLQVSNHTTATISGTLVPSTPDEIRSLPAFRGDIYATQWLLNGISYSFARTYTIRQGTQTTVTTLTNQVISPTTISRTAHTYSVTLEQASTTTTRVVVVGLQTTVVIAPVTVTGYLDYLSEFCISPRQSSATSIAAVVSTAASEQLISTTQPNSLLLWALLIAVVVAIGILLVVLLIRRQRTTTASRPPSARLALGNSGMTFCSSCGASVKAGANFCEACGKRLD